MAGDFDIPAKRVVKPVEPVRVPVKPRVSADRESSSQSFRDPATGIKFVKIPQGCFKMGQSFIGRLELIDNEGQEKYDKYYDDELPQHQVFSRR